MSVVNTTGESFASRCDADQETQVSALTPGEVSAVWREFLDLSQFSAVRAGDFKKAQ